MSLVCRSGATVGTGHGTTDWFQIRKGVCQGYILSPCLHHEKCLAGWCTSWNQDFQEKYQWPQIYRWHHPNGKSEEELKSLLIKLKEESEKSGLNLNIQKAKIMASSPITSWQMDGETMETVTDLILGSSKITVDSDCRHAACSLEENLL